MYNRRPIYRYRYDDIYPNFFDRRRYNYLVYDSQISNNEQSINNFGNMSDVSQIYNVNQIRGRRLNRN
jgi:hypothetical protein